ncbi:protein root UVB sensitive 3 isoform X2 [Andrographis paniculata]|uniref:protein root UVB sensitive 3 isoform X2 n=1 Tax=Andrographis paniculata TaxID=175694 RepID=UPI0021E73038|nr:protein root UVB sensitive 3 isoform X2 [Andrographis paniculata]
MSEETMEGESSKERLRRSRTAVIEEWNGTDSSKLTKTATITVSSDSVTKSARRFNQFSRRILDAFIPEGFPSSVTPDYVPFQIWDSLQGLSTYMRMMLSTQALLSAIGVGEKSATVLGATFQWFLRDLTGMLGGILFTFYQGANLDSNAKMWRLVADLMNDLAGVASGATRAALTQHFALQNNAADISAKEGSQETVATMMGMALGMLLARITMGHSLIIWFCFLSLTVFHMYANYKAVCCLSLNTLNFERSSILLTHYMETGQVLSPKLVSGMEHVLPQWMSLWARNSDGYLHHRIFLGARISSLDNNQVMELTSLATSYYNKGKYLLLQRKSSVIVIIHKDSTSRDILQAYIHALTFAKFDDNKDTSLHLQSQSWMATNYDTFVLKLQSSGWRTERLSSPSIAWKAYWFTDEKLD